jgi:hypothetical protein
LDKAAAASAGGGDDVCTSGVGGMRRGTARSDFKPHISDTPYGGQALTEISLLHAVGPSLVLNLGSVGIELLAI